MLMAHKGSCDASAEKQPSELPKARKAQVHGVEGDEEPQNEPGTSSNSKPTDPVLPYHQRPAASTQGPTVLDNSADEGSEKSDEKSAQSQDFHTTQYFPDLYVLTSDGHWTTTPETHKYAAAAGPFCFLTSENGENIVFLVGFMTIFLSVSALSPSLVTMSSSSPSEQMVKTVTMMLWHSPGTTLTWCLMRRI